MDGCEVNPNHVGLGRFSAMTQGPSVNKADKIIAHATKYSAGAQQHVCLSQPSALSFLEYAHRVNWAKVLIRGLQLCQVVQECTGFCATSGKSIWHVLLLPGCTALTTTLAKVAPQLAAKLLVPCDLQQADYILVKLSHAVDLPSKHCKVLVHIKYI